MGKTLYSMNIKLTMTSHIFLWSKREERHMVRDCILGLSSTPMMMFDLWQKRIKLIHQVTNSKNQEYSLKESAFFCE
jgi:hypothetical protein